VADEHDELIVEVAGPPGSGQADSGSTVKLRPNPSEAGAPNDSRYAQ